MLRASASLFGLILTLPLFLGACKGDDPAAARKVCETRKEWKHSLRKECVTCLAKAATPKCNSKCTDKEYSGRCSSEDEAMRKEPTCEGVLACVLACSKDDCDCVDRCYEGKPACHAVGAARDACTTDVCDAYCR
jgi:hypothetical protein